MKRGIEGSSLRALIIFVVLLTPVALSSCRGETGETRESTNPPATEPAPPPVSKGRRLPPVDGAARDPTFLKFREELLQAVDRHDAQYVVSILDPHIKNSFGGDGGVEEFKQMWKPEQTDSELWKELRTVLRLGGAFKEDSFWAPYIFANFPDLSDVPDYDAEQFRFGAVIEDNVLLRAKPDSNAPTVALLSYHIVKALDEDNLPPNWSKVMTTDGLEGYISSSTFRFPIDYRASFVKTNGTWRMNMFLAGD